MEAKKVSDLENKTSDIKENKEITQTTIAQSDYKEKLNKNEDTENKIFFIFSIEDYLKYQNILSLFLNII